MSLTGAEGNPRPSWRHLAFEPSLFERRLATFAVNTPSRGHPLEADPGERG
jgi:hypothetical protein